MASFENHIGDVMQAEGGLSTNRADRGGITKYGISKRSYPNLDIAAITPKDAAVLYRVDYWDKIGAGNMPDDVAAVAFDTAVNHGVGTARKLLQKTGGDPRAMLDERKSIYDRLANNEGQAQFHGGWMKRLEGLASKIGNSVIGTAEAADKPRIPTRAEFLQMKMAESAAGAGGKTRIPTRAEFLQMKLKESEGAADVEYGGRKLSDMGDVSKFLIGTGNAAMDYGRGAMQATGMAGDDGFGSQKDIAESRALAKGLNKSGAGKAGGFFGSIAPGLVIPGSSLGALVGQSAAFGALQPTLGDESRAKNIAYSAAGGALGKGVASGLGKAVKGFQASDDALSLMAEGIQPTLGQGIKQGVIGKGIRGVEEASQSLPFLGAITKHGRDRARNEFTARVISEAEMPGVSAKGKIGHEAIANLKEGFGNAYDDALKGHKIPIKPELSENIGKDIADNSFLLNDAERGQLTKFLQGRFSAMKPDAKGNYLASDMREIESQIGEKIRSMATGDDKRRLLEKVKDTLVAYREANLPEGVSKAIREINSKYAVYTRLREAAKMVGAEHGEFTPSQLYSKAVTMDKSGQASSGNALLQKLSGQGKSVLVDKVGDSGTAPRLITNKLLAGTALETGAALSALPQTAALAGLLGLGATRPVQKALLGGYKGQKVLSGKINKLGKIMSITGASQGRSK